jgi:hypothetical protein
VHEGAGGLDPRIDTDGRLTQRGAQFVTHVFLLDHRRGRILAGIVGDRCDESGLPRLDAGNLAPRIEQPGESLIQIERPRIYVVASSRNRCHDPHASRGV